jgi:hypothetical protein
VGAGDEVNKYGAKKSVFQGITYDSKLEMGMAMVLTDMLKRKEIKLLLTQHPIKIVVGGRAICTHKVDFLVTLLDGRRKFVESKGVATSIWRLKRKLVEALYPDTPYLVNPTSKEIVK